MQNEESSKMLNRYKFVVIPSVKHFYHFTKNSKREIAMCDYQIIFSSYFYQDI